MNKNLSKALLGGIALAIIAAFVEPTALETADTMYTIAGLLMLVAGTWLSINILNNK